MSHIILSAIALSIVHALIPNHWLPLVAVGRAEHWERRTTLWATAISGFAHVLSTIIIGIFIGAAGYKLSSSYRWISTLVAPSILIGLGLIYITRNFFKHGHHHHFPDVPLKKASVTAIIFSLSVAMFFSPCLELESFYFTAGTYGWLGIIIVSAIYLVVTVSVMMLLVALLLHGIYRFQFNWLEKNDKLVIGLTLLVIGLIAYTF